MLEWALRRWHLKVLAIGLAFAVWVAVIGEGRSVSDYHVPVDISLASDAALLGAPPTNVLVRLRGPESLLRRLDPFDLSVRVDLRDAPSGDQSVTLTSRHVAGVPRDVEVALVEPDRLRLTVAHKKRREVPVVPTIVGRPPRGYAVYGASARPSALEVEGPDTKLTAQTRLKTDPIRVDDQREAFVARVGATPDTPNIRVSDSRPLDVTVYVDLAPVTATIERVPVVVVNGGPGAASSPSSVVVTVSAPSSLVPKLRAGHLRAVADGGDGPLHVEFPGLDPDERAKVTVLDLSPKKVTARRSTR
ncbi:MAG TPA: CdaR family protein [Candidatus Polarisedimenticolaceae bacterium]|nr:CdaR family protein [Candidatus Polarisedimenticolaceae bacterium]